MPKTEGVALMHKLNEGRLTQAEPEFLRKTRQEISQEIEELLESGARIRPLYVGEERIGWVRGVHLSERRQLARYLPDRLELTRHLLRTGTSLSPGDITNLTAIELRSLVRLVTEMTNSDLRLYPYIAPFVTTSASEQLWFSRGVELTAFQRRSVIMPDGAEMVLLAAPDQARLWAALCNYRQEAKRRLDASMNALMVVRPWAGKSADGLASELKATAKSLLPDRSEPWTEVIRQPKNINLNDGWAHGEDDSIEGIQREIEGMLSNDRHEQVIRAFEERQWKKVQDHKQQIEQRIEARGLDVPGFVDQKTRVSTRDEIRQRVQEIRRRKRLPEEQNDQSAITQLRRYE